MSSRGIEPWPQVQWTKNPEHLVALLGDTGRVEPPPGDVGAHATRLVDAPPRRGAARAGCRRPSRRPPSRRSPRPRCTRTASRRRPGIGVRAGSSPGGAGAERRASGSPGTSKRDHALHVHGATTPDVAVRDVARRTGRASSRRRRSPGQRRGARGAGTGRRRCRPPRSRAKHRAAAGERARGPRARGRTERSSSAIRFAGGIELGSRSGWAG